MYYDATPVNLTYGKAALQSSYSPFSQLNEPLNAISGQNTGTFSFHTDHENGPWWLVDLGEVAHVTSIKVYNRGDGAQYRARFLTIELFDPARGGWRLVYEAENEFGSVLDGLPLVINFGSQPRAAQYVKLALRATGILHLDQIEILGHRPTLAYKARIAERQGPAPYLDRFGPESGEPEEAGAIVALVRGYSDLDDYDALIARNAAIYATINSRAIRQYPVIIWHEGNINPDHQRYILSKEKNADVRFIDVSERFQLPPDVTVASLKEHWPVGYRLMCKLNTWDIWEMSSKFKFILRIDEDCIFEELAEDPFEWIERQDLDCGFSLLIDDTHEITNETLPCFTAAYASFHGLDWRRSQPVTTSFPYTNVMMARTAFFRSREVSRFLRTIVLEPDFYTNRWGDHIVLGVPLNVYSSEARIKPLPGLVYNHHSHLTMVRANDDHRQQRIRPPLSFDAQDASERERGILQIYRDWPIDNHARDSVIKVSSQMGREQVARLLSVCGQEI